MTGNPGREFFKTLTVAGAAAYATRAASATIQRHEDSFAAGFTILARAVPVKTWDSGGRSMRTTRDYEAAGFASFVRTSVPARSSSVPRVAIVSPG